MSKHLKYLDVHYDQLNSDKKFAIAYLNSCYDEYIKTGDIKPFLYAIRDINEAKGQNKNQLAKLSGLTRQHIAKIYKSDTMPSLETLKNVLNPLGIKLQFTATSDNK